MLPCASQGSVVHMLGERLRCSLEPELGIAGGRHGVPPPMALKPGLRIWGLSSIPSQLELWSSLCCLTRALISSVSKCFGSWLGSRCALVRQRFH